MTLTELDCGLLASGIVFQNITSIIFGRGGTVLDCRISKFWIWRLFLEGTFLMCLSW